MFGPDCKLVWAQDAQGEIGKRPTLEPEYFEISAETYCSLQVHDAYVEQQLQDERNGKRRRK